MVRKAKLWTLGIALLFVCALYLSGPFILLPSLVGGEPSVFVVKLYSLFYSAPLKSVSPCNPYRQVLASYTKNLCASHPGRCSGNATECVVSGT